jgi:hypothetical protein
MADSRHCNRLCMLSAPSSDLVSRLLLPRAVCWVEGLVRRVTADDANAVEPPSSTVQRCWFRNGGASRIDVSGQLTITEEATLLNVFSSH